MKGVTTGCCDHIVGRRGFVTNRTVFCFTGVFLAPPFGRNGWVYTGWETTLAKVHSVPRKMGDTENDEEKATTTQEWAFISKNEHENLVTFAPPFFRTFGPFLAEGRRGSRAAEPMGQFVFALPPASQTRTIGT